MSNRESDGIELDHRLARLRGRLADLERRVEALSELASRLPDSDGGLNCNPDQDLLFYDSEYGGSELF